MKNKLPWIILILIVGIAVAVVLLKPHLACGTGYHQVHGTCVRR